MKKFITLLIFLTALKTEAQEQGTYIFEREAPVNAPVYVFGSANEGNGQRNSFLLEQNSEENPLGNPISENNSLIQNNSPENQNPPLGAAVKKRFFATIGCSGKSAAKSSNISSRKSANR